MVILIPQYLNVWMTLFFTFLVSDKPFTLCQAIISVLNRTQKIDLITSKYNF